MIKLFDMKIYFLLNGWSLLKYGKKDLYLWNLFLNKINNSKLITQKVMPYQNINVRIKAR